MTVEVDELWRRGITAHLLALHDAARLDLQIRDLPAEDADAEQRRHLGHDLYDALFRPGRTTSWRCPNRKRPTPQSGVLHNPKVLDVTNGRLVTIPVDRPVRMPSGWRPERWLIIDLRLLATEKHPGFHIHCPHCDRVHLFDLRRLQKRIGSPSADHGEPSTVAPPPHYPAAEQAAFAEIWGPYNDLTTELAKEAPEIYLYLTPHRTSLLEEALVNRPGLPIYRALLAGPALRVTSSTGGVRLQHAISPHGENQRIWERVDPPIA